MRPLLSLQQLPDGTSKGVSLEHKHYFVVHYDNKIYVYINSCPHLSIPLEWQQDQFLDEDGELIKCHTHGALFTIEDGLCIEGPCLGKFLQAVPHKISGDQILID